MFELCVRRVAASSTHILSSHLLIFSFKITSCSFLLSFRFLSFFLPSFPSFLLSFFRPYFALISFLSVSPLASLLHSFPRKHNQPSNKSRSLSICLSVCMHVCMDAYMHVRIYVCSNQFKSGLHSIFTWQSEASILLINNQNSSAGPSMNRPITHYIYSVRRCDNCPWP